MGPGHSWYALATVAPFIIVVGTSALGTNTGCSGMSVTTLKVYRVPGLHFDALARDSMSIASLAELNNALHFEQPVPTHLLGDDDDRPISDGWWRHAP